VVVELVVDVFRDGMVVLDVLFASFLIVLVLLVWREGWRFMVWVPSVMLFAPLRKGLFLASRGPLFNPSNANVDNTTECTSPSRTLESRNPTPLLFVFLTDVESTPQPFSHSPSY
jgi:hypothetical protein